MTALAIAPLAAGDGGRYVALAGALALLVGSSACSDGSRGSGSWPTCCRSPPD